MSHQDLDTELQRRLTEISTNEVNDPVHAKLGGKSLTAFLVVVVLLVVIPWVGVSVL